jgi:hypothetical protein
MYISKRPTSLENLSGGTPPAVGKIEAISPRESTIKTVPINAIRLCNNEKGL